MNDGLTTANGSPAMALLGWREWVSLPDLGIQWVKAKVDTGARTSALHAVEIQKFELDDAPWVRCTAIPWQRCEDGIPLERRLIDERMVRSSNGVAELRPVIATTLTVAGSHHLIEVNLTDRNSMNFRMLLGREALRHRFLVDPAASYCSGLPPEQVLARSGRSAEQVLARDGRSPEQVSARDGRSPEQVSARDSRSPEQPAQPGSAVVKHRNRRP